MSGRWDSGGGLFPRAVAAGEEAALLAAFRYAGWLAARLADMLRRAGVADYEIRSLVPGVDADGGPVVYLDLTTAGWSRLRRLRGDSKGAAAS